ncbi:DUF4434 domain-containing protein [Sorangium sp. So ce341]|uniref:DUF4434 domain-containing protein n=1 Tax=Sorangium sp. So ce341 TaxID=3133302 RepID=UPI003F6000A3
MESALSKGLTILSRTAAIGVCLSLTSSCNGAWARHPQRACPGGFESTFIQISERELGYGVAEWTRALVQLQPLGVTSIVLQYSGDELGPFDGRLPGKEPVRALLRAAEPLGIRVLLGLYLDPRWPKGVSVDIALPSPLDRPDAAAGLARTCAAAPACAGWYLPQEIDDATWSSAERTRSIRRFLSRAARELRRLSPGRPVAISPFFTGTLGPEEHARWWGELLSDRPVDVLMLQDGVGSGHGSAEAASRMLAALRPVTRARGVELWSTVELFRQVHGPPRDDLPFEAVPAELATVLRSTALERAAGARLVAFSVLDYMNPERGAAAARLFDGYAAWCRERGSGGAVR